MAIEDNRKCELEGLRKKLKFLNDQTSQVKDRIRELELPNEEDFEKYRNKWFAYNSCESSEVIYVVKIDNTGCLVNSWKRISYLIGDVSLRHCKNAAFHIGCLMDDNYPEYYKEISEEEAKKKIEEMSEWFRSTI